MVSRRFLKRNIFKVVYIQIQDKSEISSSEMLKTTLKNTSRFFKTWAKVEWKIQWAS